MKLTRIAVGGSGAGSAIQIDRFGQELNLIFFANGTEKDRFKNFLRFTLFGSEAVHDELQNGFEIAARSPQSFLEAQYGMGLFRVQRDNRTGIADHVVISPVSGSSASTTVSQLIQGIDVGAYDSFFNVSINQTHILVQRLIEQIQSRFGVRLGRSNWNHSIPYSTWKNEVDARHQQLDSLRARQSELELDKHRFQSEIDRFETEHLTHSRSVDRQIDERERFVNGQRVSLQSLRNQLVDIESYASDLRARIQALNSQPRNIPVETRTHDTLQLHYQRLDEIEHQIRRWRLVQTDVHNERVRLRDEMAIGDRLSLEADEHPLHVARELIAGMEGKVDTTESIARKLVGGSHMDKTEAVLNSQRIMDLCGLMRDDLDALCQELGRQYKHIRHRTAVAEMKQLRRCYHEMDENIKRLVRRREQVLEEIRKLDPAGVDAIIENDAHFCECAEREGYYEARRRLIGSVQQETNFMTTAVDTSFEQREFMNCENRRQLLLAEIASAELQLANAEAELARLKADSPSCSKNDIDRIRTELDKATNEWLSVDLQIKGLMVRIEEDRRLAKQVPDPFMSEASQYLLQLTQGRLQQPAIDRQQNLTVITADGQPRSIQEIDRGQQDLVCFALIATAIRAYADKGVWLPLVVDHLFVNLDAAQRGTVLMVLTELARQGHQVIALTNDHSILKLSLPPDRLNGVSIQRIELAFNELPDTHILRPMGDPMLIPRPVPPYPLDSGYEGPATQPTSPRISNTTGYERVPTSSSISIDGSNGTRRITFETRLTDIDLVESIYITPLESCGIARLVDLLALDPKELPPDVFRRGFLENQIDRWQAQAWLLICLPELKPHDARILVACGIHEPEQLDAIEGNELFDRIKSFLGSADGRRAGVNLTRYDRIRIDDWQQSLRKRRTSWYHRDGYSRYRHRRLPEWPTRVTSEHFKGSTGSAPVRCDDDRCSTGQAPKPRTVGRLSAKRTSTDQTSIEMTSELKFHLETSDDISAAPSIGARTAERFYKIGIQTVADFLKGNSKAIAAKINFKRISEEVIQNWQQQTRLMVQIPNMRVHDVQLLVACGFNDASEIERMEPAKLFGIIKPFSESKDGERILRSNKKPDLNEIKEWIEAARHKRTLQAA